MLSSALGSTVDELASSMASKTIGDTDNEKPLVHKETKEVHDESLEQQDFSLTDEELIPRAMAYYRDDKLLAAARLLEQVQDENAYTEQHIEIKEKAKLCQKMVDELLQPPLQKKSKKENSENSSESESKWQNQGQYECSDKDGSYRYSTQIYYKMDEGDKKKKSSMKLTVRCETPIEPSMLVPLLSVLNESELYSTWLPSWTKPIRMGVTESKKLHQSGRANQIVSILSDVPWPLCQRQVILSALAIDDIDDRNHIVVKLQSLDTGDAYGGEDQQDDGQQQNEKVIPPPNKSTTRVELDGGFLFRNCPIDHPCLPSQELSSITTTSMATTSDEDEKKEQRENDDDEHDSHDKILVCVSFFVDAKINFLPMSVINFVVRTVIGKSWSMFLHVARDVFEGKRPAHAKAIEQKRSALYDWVDERVQKMLSCSLSSKANIQ